MPQVGDSILIYDIETRVYGKPDPQKDKFRLFGCYSYKTNKIYMLTRIDQVQKALDSHKFLVGFNTVGTKIEPGYDNTVLKRAGIKWPKYARNIDLRNIFRQRASQMKIEKGMLGNILMKYSLDFITKTIGVVDKDSAKIEIDYKLFEKDTWTKEEVEEIKTYTERDINVTKRLYEWVEEYFAGFKDFLDLNDVRKKTYLTCSTAKFAYKAICKALNWEEKYGEGTKDDNRIKGGYVAYPAGSQFSGNLYCLDFRSLYPHIMIQCNLYGRKPEGAINERPMWTGGGKWKVNGVYYADALSGVGKLLKKWYADRVAYKKAGDRREYTIKIIINVIYGILNNPYYNRVYDRVAGGDCTRIGRQWVKHARIIFKKHGYPLLYTDTDSVYIEDPFNDKEKMLRVKDEIVKYIKTSVPFPQDSFDMGIDDEIKHLFFFKGGSKDRDTDIEMDDDDFINKPKGYMKKNYLYVTQKGKIKVKNLGIVKKNTSQLSKKIFYDYLSPKIKEGQILFGKKYLKDLINELLSKDLELAFLRKEVGNLDQYKSKTSLPAQIAQKYGSGIHFLIPNTAGKGVGKGKNFCTFEEFEQANLTIHHINLDNVWKELDYFLKPVKIVNIFDFEKK